MPLALVFADLKWGWAIAKFSSFHFPQKSNETAVALVGMNYALQI
jgi:hypothetical protein